MKFYILKYGSRLRDGEYPYVELIRDDWDDYGYKTSFHSYLNLSPSKQYDLGAMRILNFHQKGGSTQFDSDSFDSLSDDYCSLGLYLDEYYETLFKLGQSIYEPYLRSLRDLSFDEVIKAKFEDHEGFRVSLNRGGGIERLIDDAGKLFTDLDIEEIDKSEGFKFNFQTMVSSESNKFIVEFDLKTKALYLQESMH